MMRYPLFVLPAFPKTVSASTFGWSCRLLAALTLLVGNVAIAQDKPEPADPPVVDKPTVPSKKSRNKKNADKEKKAAEEESVDTSASQLKYFAPRKMDMQFGMRFYTNDNMCTQMHATIAFPTDWPEQTVTLKSSNIPGNANWAFRDMPKGATLPGARQLVMDIPGLRQNSELEILFDVQIEKSFIDPPEDKDSLVIPKKINKELNWYIHSSPMIDCESSEVRKIAKSIAQNNPSNAWSHVEMIYDWVRDNVKYRNGQLRHTRETLKTREGDCEEMSGLFVAICRASDIPARCVWIPEHCYPEFYLEDAAGKGHWIPCQVAGDRQFGQMHDYRPILQKGDKFTVPEKTGPQHYLSEYFSCQQTKFGPTPASVEPVLDLGPLQTELDALKAANPPPSEEETE